jgi:hypothetical protein
MSDKEERFSIFEHLVVVQACFSTIHLRRVVRHKCLGLSPPETASEIDGYLSASDIAGLKLDADWAILSTPRMIAIPANPICKIHLIIAAPPLMTTPNRDHAS